MKPLEKARSRAWNKPTEKVRRVPLLALVTGSFFFVGLSPVASGTVASAVAAILYYTLPFLQSNLVLIGLCLVCLVGGAVASDVIVLLTEEHDSGIIVIDEVLGQWATLLTFWYHGDVVFVISAFIFFRVFDILKIYPASRFERSVGGTSIMLDDLVAGMYGNIAAHLTTYGYYKFFA